MTFTLNLSNILMLILSIIVWVILFSLFLYQIELKRRFLFSTLLCLSVNTIPEEETDYLFESSSEEMADEKLNLPSETKSGDGIASQDGESVKGFIMSKKSLLDLRLDLIQDGEASSVNSSNFNEVIEPSVENRNVDPVIDQTNILVNENRILPDATEVIEKGLKIKPNMHIDLSSVSFDVESSTITSRSILDVLPADFDPTILEAYIPFPELMTLSDFAATASLGLC